MLSLYSSKYCIRLEQLININMHLTQVVQIVKTIICSCF